MKEKTHINGSNRY
uniref:Hypothetical 1.6K protein n=2 Tax=Solanum TaxID=4107 RepID=Q7M2E5_SOLTU